MLCSSLCGKADARAPDSVMLENSGQFKFELPNLHGILFTWLLCLMFCPAGTNETVTSLSSVAVTLNDFLRVQHRCLHLSFELSWYVECQMGCGWVCMCVHM